MVKIAIIGDIHRHFNARDVTIFNRSEYDLLLISGDLVDFRSKEALPVADQLAQLRTPALFIAGNHDCTNLVQFLAEVKGISSLAQLSSAGQDKRVARLKRHLEPVRFAAYSCHDFMINNEDFSVIAARPFSLGGPELGFRPYLRRKYGVNTVQDSVRRLQKLIDASTNDTLIFLAHNGPTGLGSSKDDIWGCDFRDEGGDHGDPDLYEAIRYAKDRGKRVTAVVAGHMHHELTDGGQRQWLVQADGTIYINAARVPRIFKQGEETVHHHLSMSLEEGEVIVEEILVR